MYFSSAKCIPISTSTSTTTTLTSTSHPFVFENSFAPCWDFQHTMRLLFLVKDLLQIVSNSLSLKCMKKKQPYFQAMLRSFFQTPKHNNQQIGIHEGKSRWHRYHVLVYISPVLTYLLGTVSHVLWPCYGPSWLFFNSLNEHSLWPPGQ